MPQVAQQDYIRINIADFANLTDNEVQEIRNVLARGLIFDTIMSNEKDDGIHETRPLAIWKTSDGTIISLFDAENTEYFSITIPA